MCVCLCHEKERLKLDLACRRLIISTQTKYVTSRVAWRIIICVKCVHFPYHIRDQNPCATFKLSQRLYFVCTRAVSRDIIFLDEVNGPTDRPTARFCYRATVAYKVVKLIKHVGRHHIS
jgi:hypothetical protein